MNCGISQTPFTNSWLLFVMLIAEVVLGLLLCSSGVHGEVGPDCEVSIPAGYERVAQNDFLELFMDMKTTEIAVRSRETGMTIFSNPPGRGSNERIAKGAAKERLGSQFVITYYDDMSTRYTMDNRNDSVAYDQFTVSSVDNGVRVHYTLGLEWKDNDYLPLIIGKERFEDLILANVDEKQRRLILKNYIEVSLVPIADESDRLNVYQLDSNKVFGDWTLMPVEERLSDSQRAKLIAHFVDTIIENRRDLELRGDLTADRIPEKLKEPTYLLKQGVKSWDVAGIIKAIQTTPYTPEDKIEDCLEYGLEPPVENAQVFEVAIEYRIDGPNLLVTVPAGSIKYSMDVEQAGEIVSFPLTQIDVLPYLGAAGVSEEGYMVVPDGCGARINLNNGKVVAPSYTSPVYGPDAARRTELEQTWVSQQISIPVFGIKSGDEAIVGIIDKGDAYARINAEIAGKVDCYNKVWPSFTVLPRSTTSLHGDTFWTLTYVQMTGEIGIYQYQRYMEDFQVRYSLLSADNAGYVGMANEYHDYLASEYSLEKLAESNHIPFFLELIGAIDKRRSVMGIPMNTIEPLTTFDEAVEVVDDALAFGIDGIRVRYSGALEGGMNPVAPTGCSLEKKLGNESSFRGLTDWLEQRSIPLYLDVDFLNVYKDTLMDGFSSRLQASRALNRKPAVSYSYDPATSQSRDGTSKYVVSPRVLGSLIDSFVVGMDRLGAEALSLRNYGRQLSSDFVRNEKQVGRQEAQELMMGQLEKLKSVVGDLLIDGGNKLVLPYAKSMVNLPVTSSGHALFDEDIPLYQIVVHGYIDYASSPFNLVQTRNHILRSVEYGSLPYYVWGYRDPSAIQNTLCDQYYSTDYRYWLATASEVYADMDSALAPLRNKRIVDHEKLGEGLYTTTYEDGTSVVVNYGSEQVEVLGVMVPGGDYRVVKGER